MATIVRAQTVEEWHAQAQVARAKGDVVTAKRCYLQAIEAAPSGKDSSVVPLIKLRADFGVWLMGLKEYNEAEAQFRTAYELLGERAEAAGPRASIMIRMADLYQTAGNHEKHERALKKAYALHRKNPDPDLAATLEVALRLGGLLVTFRKYEEGIAYLTRASILTRKLKGPRSPETVGLLQKLATARSQFGKKKDAEADYARAWAIVEESKAWSGDTHFLLLQNRTMNLLEMGDAEAAETSVKKMVEVIGDHDSRTMSDVESLLKLVISVYERLGKDPEEQGPVIRVRSMLEQLAGGNDDQLVEHLYLAGNQACNDQDYVLCEAKFREALTLAEKLHGSSDPVLVKILARLGDALRMVEKLEESERMLLRAVALQEARTDRPRWELSQVLMSLAEVHSARGNVDEQIEVRKRMIELSKAESGSRSAAVGSDLFMLGMTYRSANRFQEGLDVLQQALEIVLATGGATAPQVEMIQGEIEACRNGLEAKPTAPR